MPWTRKVLISKGFVGIAKTVGEHILKKRLEAGLTQDELAAKFDVDSSTVLKWERGHVKTIPATRMPALINFLGYNPEIEPDTVGARLRWKRRSLGWTCVEAARRNCVDPSTWETWEKLNGWPAYPRFRDFLREFLAMRVDDLVVGTRQVRPAV